MTWTGIAFRDLLANCHSITINDDHDVFHGNIWGESGKAADMTQQGAAAQQDSGGFKMVASFVNLVQQGQCGHLHAAHWRSRCRDMAASATPHAGSEELTVRHRG